MKKVILWGIGPVVGFLAFGLTSISFAFEGHYQLMDEQGYPGEYHIYCPDELQISSYVDTESGRMFLELAAPHRSAFAYFGKELSVRSRDPEGNFFGYIRSGGVVRDNYASNIDSLTVLAKSLYGLPLRYTEGKRLRASADGEWIRFSQHRRLYGLIGLGFGYHCEYQRLNRRN